MDMNNNIDEGINICPICQHNITEPFLIGAFDRQWEINSSKTFDYNRCKNCDFIFISPSPLYYNTQQFYPSKNEYYAYNQQNIPYLFKVLEKYYSKKNILSKVINYSFYPHLQKISIGRLLDVGCGVGHFLNVMKLFGWDTWGIEQDFDAKQVANKQHHIIDEHILRNNNNLHDSFDLITMTQVIEHIPNPKDLLVAIHKILKNTGTIYITTPNAGSHIALKYGIDWRGLECPRHVCLYNPNSLKQLLMSTGYEIEICRTRFAPSDWFESHILRTQRVKNKNSFLEKLNYRKYFYFLFPNILFSILRRSEKYSLLEVVAKKKMM